MTAIDQRRTTSRAVLTILRAREVGLVVLIALVVLATTLHNHHFVDSNSIEQLLSGAAPMRTRRWPSCPVPHSSRCSA